MAAKENIPKGLMDKNGDIEVDESPSNSSLTSSPTKTLAERTPLSPFVSARSTRLHSRPKSPGIHLGRKTNSSSGPQQDLRFWRKIVLQWISECKFIEQNYFNIEQTNIDEFYNKFKVLMFPSRDVVQSNQTILDFLYQHYKDFEPHLDDENELSSSDYIYVYSLLFHYSCVTNAHPFFHDTCKKLSTPTQMMITEFFKSLMQFSSVNRDNLRGAIASIAENYSFKSISPAGSSNGSSNGSSPSFNGSESPIRTPKRMPGPQKLSPTTPKSFLLEEKTRELMSLKAQIETERYEKGLMEVQIKQYEDTIDKITREHRKISQELKEMKSQFLSKNKDVETSTPWKFDDDQTRRRLINEISSKEADIEALTEQICVLQEEKQMTQEKMKYTQEQMANCIQKISELESKVQSLNQALSEKETTIADLIYRNTDLERHLSEIQEDKNRDMMNSSVDFFDNSFSRTTNSSGNSTSQPENLAVAVIDKQLKAVQKENSNLKEEYENLKEYNKGFGQNIFKVLHSYAEELNKQRLQERRQRRQLKPNQVSLEKMSPRKRNQGGASSSASVSSASAEDDEDDEDDDDDDLQYLIKEVMEKDLAEVNDISSGFNLFCSFFAKINEYFLTEKNQAKRLTEKNYKLVKTNEDLTQKINAIKTEMEDVKEKAMSIAIANKDMEMAQNAMAAQLSETAESLSLVKSEKNELNSRLKTLEKESAVYKELTEKQLNEYKNQTLNLSESNIQLTEMKRKLESELNEANLRFDKLMKDYEEGVNSLSQSLKKAESELKESQQRELELNADTMELKAQIRKLEKSAKETDKHLESVTESLNERHEVIRSLGEEMEDLLRKNNELDATLKELNIKYNIDQELHVKQINILKEENQAFRIDKSNLQMKLHEMQKSEADLVLLRERSAKIDLCLMEMFDELQVVKPSENQVINCQEIHFYIKKMFYDSTEMRNKLRELEFIKQEQAKFIGQMEERELEIKSGYEQLQMKAEQLAQQLEHLSASHDGLVKQNAELEAQRQLMIKNYESLQEQKQKEFDSILNDKELMYERSTMELEEAVRLLGEIIKATIHEKDQIIDTQELSLNQNQELISCLTLQTQELEKSLAASREKAKCLDHSLKQKNLDLQESSKQIQELELQKAQVEKELFERNKAIEEANEEMTKLNEDLQDFDEIKGNLEAHIETLKEELTQKIAIINEFDQEKQDLLRNSDLQHLQYRDLLQEKNKMNQTFNEIKLRLEETEKERSEKTLELENTMKTIIDNNEQLKELNQQLQEELQAKDSDFNDLQKEKQLLEESIKEMEKLMLSDQQKLCNSLEFNKDLINKINQIIEGFVVCPLVIIDNDNVKDTLNYFKEIEEFFDSNNNANNDSNSNLKIMINLIRNLNQILNLYKSLSLDLNLVREQSLLLEKNNHVLLRLKEQTEEDLQKKTEELKNLQDHLNQDLLNSEFKYEKELKALSHDKENLQNIIKKLTDENFQYQNKQSELEKTVYQLNTGFDGLKQEKEELINLKQNELVKYQKMLKDTENLYQELQGKVQDLLNSKQENDQQLTNLTNAYAQALEKLEIKQMENEKLQQQGHLGQEKVEALEKSLAEKSTDLAFVLKQKQELEKQCKSSQAIREEFVVQINNLKAENQSLNLKIAELKAMAEKSQLNYELLKQKVEKANEANMALLNDIASKKEEKELLQLDIREKEKALINAHESLAKMIDELAVMRAEKDKLAEEKQELVKKMAESYNNCDKSEHKLKEYHNSLAILEKSTATLQQDNESLQLVLAQTKANEDRLLSENKKLVETLEVRMKRIEKLSLQLGEHQGLLSKQEKEAAKISKSLEEANAQIESLNKEKAALQQETKTLKEIKLRLEKSEENLRQKCLGLDKDISNLRELKKKFEDLDIENAIKIKKLEKQRLVLEDKNRLLAQSSNTTETERNNLNLEVGALNSQIAELQKTKKRYETQVTEVTKSLQESKETIELLQAQNKQLAVIKETLNEENSSLLDKMSKAELAMKIAKEKQEQTIQELEAIRAEFLILRQMKAEEDSVNCTLSRENQELKLATELIHNQYKDEIAGLQQEILNQKSSLDMKDEQIKKLEKDLDDFYSRPVGPQVEDLEELRLRLKAIEQDLNEEKERNIKLRGDNQILLAKYRESKKRLNDERQTAEERVKNYRLEMEEKLDKMKARMVTLHTDAKAKYDNQLAAVKSERDLLQSQVLKFEEHTKRLSKEIVNLNDRQSQLQTENALLTTKLKFLEEKENQIGFLGSKKSSTAASSHSVATLPRTSSKFEVPKTQIPRPTSASTAATATGASNHSDHGASGAMALMSTNTSLMPAPPSRNIVSNLAMEDEEGEIFNNTYLTDLKNGGYPRLGADEIRYRNSLVPPHLRSSYAAQYSDVDFAEDDIKDISPNLDDSLSALITSTTSGNTRKKCSGVTHYKRPGPPTPSKNGRLSFGGGNSEPPREILKESNDGGGGGGTAASSNTGKTPARFSHFLSRLSMGGGGNGSGSNKEEISPTKRRKSNLFKKNK